MKKIFFLALFVLTIVNLFSQVVVPSRYDDHWSKSYLKSNGEDVFVGIQDVNYSNNKPKFRNFVVKNQVDLVLQKEYFESGKIKTLGYFKLIYDLKDENYRWVPDLLWTDYDESGILQKQILFSNGNVVKE